jgi:uncharacterized protein YfaP (DUF2135 family)
MKKLLLFAVIILTGFNSCDWVEDLWKDKDKDELSKKEIARIEEEIETISLVATQIVANAPVDTAQVLALFEEWSNLESVEKVWLDKGGIVLKVKKGGLVVWDYEHEFVIPPFFDLDALQQSVQQRSVGLKAASSSKILPENNTVGYYCSLKESKAGDRYHVKVAQSVVNVLNHNSFNATSYYDFTMDDLMKDFSKFGVVIILAHGGLYEDKTNKNEKLMGFMTGEELDRDWVANLTDPNRKGKKVGSEPNMYERWINNQIIIAYSSSPIIRVTQKFFDTYYSNGSLSNTLAFLMPCHAMENDVSIGKILEKKRKGKGVTLGYDESNTIAPVSAWYLFESLLNGYTVGESFDDFIPKECLHNIHSGGITANLVLHPESGRNVALVMNQPQGFIKITSPVNGHIYNSIDDRSLILEGQCDDFGTVTSGTVSIGASTYPLNLINGNTFRQPIEINSGENIIKVSCVGTAPSSVMTRPVTASAEITVTGNFARMPLWTAMTWDTDGTDVDLHLVGPDGVDCYFGRKTTSWGGFLDIDDIDGRGPEHITIPVLKQSGVYELYIHYYDDKGRGPSNVWVTVSTLAGDWRFGPIRLNQTDDAVLICTIHYENTRSTEVINAVGTRSSAAGDGSILFKNLPKKQH